MFYHKYILDLMLAREANAGLDSPTLLLIPCAGGRDD